MRVISAGKLSKWLYRLPYEGSTRTSTLRVLLFNSIYCAQCDPTLPFSDNRDCRAFKIDIGGLRGTAVLAEGVCAARCSPGLKDNEPPIPVPVHYIFLEDPSKGTMS